jgi:excisionase family DNA binding protein
MARTTDTVDSTSVRVGQAAEMLGVTVETLRRWETEKRIAMTRSSGGQRLVPIEEITRLLAARRRVGADLSLIHILTLPTIRLV